MSAIFDERGVSATIDRRSVSATTVGALLAGRVRYEQPVSGYRTGIEPVFLAAAVPARPGERVLEGGTGAGAALLCLAARTPGVVAVGVERDPLAAAIARRNVERFPSVSVWECLLEELHELPLFDHVCANPPWHDPAGTPASNRSRQAALHATPGTLAVWCQSLVRRLRPGGTATLILSAALCDSGRAALCGAGAGAARIRALLPKEGRPPKIVLVQAVAGAGGPARHLPGLILHRQDGRYTDAADAILRDGAALSWEG